MDKQPLHVLLVEDDEDDYIIIRDLFANLNLESNEIFNYNFKLERVSTYEAAQTAIAQQQHEVYLVNYYLDKHNGLELLEYAIKTGYTNPIILLTRRGDRAIDIKAMQAGAVDYLTKEHLRPSILERSIRYVIERKRVEDALRESEERYHTLFQNSKVGIFRNTTDGKFTFINPALVNILGYDSIEDLLAIKIPEDLYVHPEQVHLNRQQYNASGIITGIELPWRKKDGQIITVSIYGRIIRNSDGKIIAYEGLVLDTSPRKEAEKRLKKSESQNKAIFEAIPDLIFLLTHEGVLLNFKTNSNEDLVLSKEIVGTNISDILPVDIAALFQQHIKKALELDDVRPFEYQLSLPHGEQEFETRLTVSGPNEVLAIVRNITKRKTAERRDQLAYNLGQQLTTLLDPDALLTETVNRLRETFAYYHAHIYLIDQDTLLTTPETAMLLIRAGTGSKGTELKRRGHAIPLQAQKSLVAQAARSLEPVVVNDVSLHLDHLPNPLLPKTKSEAAIPLFRGKHLIGVLDVQHTQPNHFDLEQIRTLQIVAAQLSIALSNARLFAENIHQKKRLATERNLLRTVIDNLPDHIYVKDRERRYIITNATHSQFVEASSPKEVIGKTVFDFYPPELAAQYNLEDQAVFESGQALINHEEQAINASQQQKWLLTTKIPLRDQQDNIFGLVGIGRDITERRKLEEEMRQIQKMEAIGQLAGGVAHDFNNILTAIIGYAQLIMLSLPTDNPAYKDVQGIEDAAHRAANLTRQLLAFARKQIIEPEVINLDDLVLDMGKLLRRLIGEHIELMTIVTSELKYIKVDPGQIEQVIVNLVVNARDAMLEGGKLTIETRNVTLDLNYARHHADVTPGDYTMMAVTDTGQGITAAVKEHIFEPFFTTKESGQGTGLGLATCFGIVKQNGGHIEVESQPKQGTTFKVYLPSYKETYSVPKKSVALAEDLQEDETILLVEDELVVRTLAARILQQRGYDVLEAANGEEALDLILKKKVEEIHLVITDVIMPKMNGKVLANHLLTLYPKIKVLFISGYTEDIIVHHGVMKSHIAFLPKPFTPNGLIQKVRETLEKS